MDMRKVLASIGAAAGRAKARTQFMDQTIDEAAAGAVEIDAASMQPNVEKAKKQSEYFFRKYSDLMKAGAAFYGNEKEVEQYAVKWPTGGNTGLSSKEVKGLLAGRNIFLEYWQKKIDNRIKHIEERPVSITFTAKTKQLALTNLRKLKEQFK